MDDKDKLIKAVLKKAIGYDTDEVVEEFGQSDGEMVLLKRKVTTKHIPPDISAAKLALEIGGSSPPEKMSKFELIEKRKKLIEQIAAMSGKKVKSEEN